MKQNNKIKQFYTTHKSSISIIILLLVTGILFSLSYKTIFKVSYGNLNGVHSWLSGSTIKFVNNWLSETPQKLHFVNFESPDSIEFNSIIERGPYISYPTGETLLIYLCSKLIGLEGIRISVLKHIQMCFFLLETLLLALFVYRFLTRVGIKSEKEKIIPSCATAIFWACLPTTSWYLSNIYFADQCVILFAMAFLLVEYESYFPKTKIQNFILNCFKFVLIFWGVFTDYYFWILAFIAFILQILNLAREKKPLSFIIVNSLWYIAPVILALAMFIYSLTSIPNWNVILKGTFLFRTGSSTSSYNTPQYIISSLKSNFTNAFGLWEERSKRPLLLFILYISFVAIPISKKGKSINIKKSLKSKNVLILILGIVSPLLQIAVLKNHSAIHEFSMIKLAWIVAMLPIITSYILCRIFDIPSNKSMSAFMHFFVITFLTISILTNVPFSSRHFYNSRAEAAPIDYHVANTLQKYTSYKNVCFSFSHEIPNNPPQELAVSKKRVYKITNKEEINTRFPALNPEAVKILVIDKTKSQECTKEQRAVELALQNTNETIYEDETVCLVKIESLDTSVIEDIDYLFLNAEDY